jgi:hypothetical protein
MTPNRAVPAAPPAGLSSTSGAVPKAGGVQGVALRERTLPRERINDWQIWPHRSSAARPLRLSRLLDSGHWSERAVSARPVMDDTVGDETAMT